MAKNINNHERTEKYREAVEEGNLERVRLGERGERVFEFLYDYQGDRHGHPSGHHAHRSGHLRVLRRGLLHAQIQTKKRRQRL